MTVSRRIEPSNYRRMPWKNGQGVTFEIARVPDRDDYDWRLSQAEVSQDGEFSQFPGYDRLLVVTQGEGLWIDGQRLDLLMPFQFAGDDVRTCRLVSGPVRDLGLIYDRKKFRAEMLILSGHLPPLFEKPAMIQYLFDLQTVQTLENPAIDQAYTGVWVAIFKSC